MNDFIKYFLGTILFAAAVVVLTALSSVTTIMAINYARSMGMI